MSNKKTLMTALLMLGVLSTSLFATQDIVISISGMVNGTSFSGAGTVKAEPLTGQVQGTTYFQNLPSGFTPLCYGKSWKCCSHKNCAQQIGGAVNLLTLAGGNFDEYSNFYYPNGDILTVHIESRMVSTGQIDMNYTVTGNYTGPSDIVTIQGSETTWTPAGPGQITTDEIETLVRSNGELIPLHKTSTIIFVDPNVSLPSEEVMTSGIVSVACPPVSAGRTTLTLKTVSTVCPK